MSGMVKVFGCREAYENRSCTNPRRCGDGLWGFRLLSGGYGDATGALMRAAGVWE